MIKFSGKILQLGFGAVGKSFYEKVRKEIKFNDKNYYIISGNKHEFSSFINMGGLVENFIVEVLNRNNYKDLFSKYVSEGDLIIDFADTVGTKDFLIWCAENNVMYLNTGEADWPDNWYSIFNENVIKKELRNEYRKDSSKNKYPIVLQHGNNPGLVSHFVKAGIEYIVKKQFGKNKKMNELIKQGKFNELAMILGIRMIHVNDIDLQKIQGEMESNKLYSTWCIDSFFFEMLSESTVCLGTHEKNEYSKLSKYTDSAKGFLEFKSLAIDTKCNTLYPNGSFEGYLVPHEEIITIANYLEVKSEGKTIYRPTVMFIYRPCDMALDYFLKSRVDNSLKMDKEYPKNADVVNGNVLVRGFEYPKKAEIVYEEKIEDGTEYVGVLILGDNFNPVWVGNRVEKSFLYKNKKSSYWQTPTITPVAMSALAGVCWMLENKEKGDIFFPDEIPDYKYIIKKAEKYISKTIYKTFNKEEAKKVLKTDNLKINSTKW